MTKFRIISCIILVSIFLLFNNVESKTGKDDISLEELKKEIKQKGGCKVRVCFGIDVSTRVKEYLTFQTELVSKVVRVISVDPRAEFAGTDYSLTTDNISELTTDKRKFEGEVKKSKLSTNSETSVAAPIVYCHVLLIDKDSMRARGTTVLLSDGVSNFGGDPVQRADIFRQTGGKIIAVGIKKAGTTKLLDIVGGDESNVIPFKSGRSVNEYVQIIVRKLCFNQ